MKTKNYYLLLWPRPIRFWSRRRSWHRRWSRVNREVKIRILEIKCICRVSYYWRYQPGINNIFSSVGL